MTLASLWMLMGYLTSHETPLALSLAGLCLWALAALLLFYIAYESVLIVLRSKSGTRKGVQVLPFPHSTKETSDQTGHIPGDWPVVARNAGMFREKAGQDGSGD